MCWTLERYLRSTIYEFNLASAGYWRNWERQTAWLMREIIFMIIAGNPYIKNENKPKSSKDIIGITDDEKEEDKPKKLTKKEQKQMAERAELIKQKLMGI